MKTHYWETRLSMTPEKALQYLQDGNQRFINNLHLNHNLLQLMSETAERQFPFATILSCSDSRVPTELVFDQALGDIFSIRLAGNIASINAIGSMEYACKVLGSKLIVVMGHTCCGAVKSACDGLKMENLDELLAHIRPAVAAEKFTVMDRSSDNKSFVTNVARLNVDHQIHSVLQSSAVIRDLIKKREIYLVGAMYDVETGQANFFDSNFKSIIQHEKTQVYQG